MTRTPLTPAPDGYRARVHGRVVTVRRDGPLWNARLTIGHEPVIARAPHLVTLSRILGRMTPGDVRRALARDLAENGSLWLAHPEGGPTHDT
ncbi:hypothetical protein RIF23_11615 [Lipingzhangella sp. LS1_29]|uniref:Uncharacterized protein n=1 Tax=Lipingzhangella rawalii TaxID=2055835 RepID=A0ABU2H6M2_9ACTN|nr:hypothetical protein [Lipingzhangella rawalii]MDS1270946.1 hypothetical protein [Lipingzhangella rawalii]